MKKLKVILIGAGCRGIGYTDSMSEQPDKFEVVGVAEPVEDRRNYIKEKHGVSEEYCFDTWEKILEIPKFADIAIISTMDKDHSGPALKALELGYDLLMEKPVAPTPEECVQIMKQAEKYDRKIMICHVLRYTPFYNRLKNVLKSGAIGDVISVVHNEDVGAKHQSHSFVRGNWGNSDRSSCMLLQKSCHDLDIIQFLLDKECKRVQSFGSLRHFRIENAPEGAPDYCIEGCPKAEECIYNATKLYTNDDLHPDFIEWFRTTATHLTKPTIEDAEKAIRTTQYGKCVYKCDNNVVDHQVVNMEFEDGITVAFTMCAFADGGRTTKIMGTKGWIMADARKDSIEVFDHETGKAATVSESAGDVDIAITGGHGGGDAGIINALYDYVMDKKAANEVSEIGVSCKNHMLAFAAEKSRLEGKVVNIKEYMKSFEIE